MMSPTKSADAAEGGGTSTRLRFTTHTSLQPVGGEGAPTTSGESGIAAAGPPPYTPPPAVATATAGEGVREDATDGGCMTNVEIISQSPPPQRRDSISSSSTVGTNTEIEVFCSQGLEATTSEPSGVAKEVMSLTGLPPALFGDQKEAEEDEELAGKSGKTEGGKKKSRIRDAIDAVGLSAVCFYFVVWLSLFLFNAVCLVVLWLLVPCMWGGQSAGCILLPACPTSWSAGFAATPAGHMQHPI